MCDIFCKSMSVSENGSQEELLPFTARDTVRRSHAQDMIRQSVKGNFARLTRACDSQELAPLRNSQAKFATPEHTVLVYDWDDTLFPTFWMRHEKLKYRLPLEEQRGSPQKILEIRESFQNLELEVLALLTQSLRYGHVVIVTLARSPWVSMACKNFFPQVGKFIDEHSIKVVYAQDLDSGSPNCTRKFASEGEAQLFWIQQKQRAIMGEISAFYAKSDASWKNVISFGDSNFERFATQKLLRDYATVSSSSQPVVGSAAHHRAVLAPCVDPSGAIDAYTVSGYVGQHFHRLRCKTVKMFEFPTVDDLMSEMTLIRKWLPTLVSRDAGIDVDLEDEVQLEQLYMKIVNSLGAC